MTILIQTQKAARRAAVFILPPADGCFKESLLKIFIFILHLILQKYSKVVIYGENYSVTYLQKRDSAPDIFS